MSKFVTLSTESTIFLYLLMKDCRYEKLTFDIFNYLKLFIKEMSEIESHFVCRQEKTRNIWLNDENMKSDMPIRHHK